MLYPQKLQLINITMYFILVFSFSLFAMTTLFC